MINSKSQNISIIFDKKKENITTKNFLLILANNSNKELNKNKILLEMILFYQNQINKYKQTLSKISKNSKINNKINIKNILIENNQVLIDSKKSINNEIKEKQKKYNIDLQILSQNTQQLKNVLYTLQEKNFLIENKIKEKDSLISRLEELLYNFRLNIYDFDLINEIDENYLGNENNSIKFCEKIAILNSQFYHEYLLLKSIKFNKLSNKNNNLVQEKNKLKKIIKEIKNKNKINENNIYDNNYDDNINKNNKEIICLENNSNKDYSSKSNIKITNFSTEGSIFNENDSLYFDTEEQIDIEFPDNDFSDYYLSQKNLVVNLVKKKIVVPPLDFRLIEYKKNRKGLSYDETSLSRNFQNDSNDSQYLIIKNIKILKKKIKSINRQNENLAKKCQKYEKKIRQIALFLYTNSNKIYSI